MGESGKDAPKGARWSLTRTENCIDGAWKQDRIIEKAQDGLRHTVIWEMST